MCTPVLYAPRGNPLREQGAQLLRQHQIEFCLQDWGPDDPERRDDVCLVSSAGEFAGLNGLQFFVERHRDLAMLAAKVRFPALARRWLSQTKYCATIEGRTHHPAFREIVSLGEPVVPLVLEALKNQPEHWFWVLAELTHENPVPAEACGNVDALRDAWLEWGRMRGYL